MKFRFFIGTLCALVILLSGCQVMPVPSSVQTPAAAEGLPAAEELLAEEQPAPEPVKFSGSGEAELALDLPWEGPAALRFQASEGEEPFQVSASAGLEMSELIQSEGAVVDAYRGLTLSSADPKRLIIKGDRDWQVEVIPVHADYFPVLQVPATYEGQTSAVLLIRGDHGIAKFDTTRASRLEAWGFGEDPAGQRLTITSKGDYKGNAVLPKHTTWMVVDADGPWSVLVQENCCDIPYLK